jgi:stage V sporulation protein G
LQFFFKKPLQIVKKYSKIELVKKYKPIRGTFMKITETRVRLVKKEDGKLKAVASITIDDCFVVHDVKILEGNDGEYFIAMPSKKTPEGEYKDIVHPLNTETREQIKSVVLEAFKKVKEETPAE